MPHIVHVYKDYWPPILGGIERTVHWMATGLVRRGYEVTVLVNSRERAARERELDGVRIVEVGEWRRFASAPLSPGFPAAMRRLKADVWHFHVPNPTGDVSYLLTQPAGRVVATYHSDIVRQKWALWAYGPVLRRFLARCDVVMPTSPRLIDSSPFLRAVREKCEVVPLAMPLDKYERTGASGLRAREVKARYKGFPLLVFLGKLRYYKGLQFLVSAMRSVPHAHALIIGEGPEGPNLEVLARELGVADRVHFLGELDDDDVVAHLQAADVFVLPSHLNSEAYGLSQIEAMACGLPVVSCDLPTGVPFVNRHGETGLVVPPGDDGALAEAISRLLSDERLRFAMGEAAYRRAREVFSVEAMMENLVRIYV
ncbi:MAG: glycosyltransferase [Sumerlaeia bacterium]